MLRPNVIFFILFGLVLLLLISAFFSASEVALLALSRIRLRHMVSRNVRNAKVVNKLVSNLDKLITTILVGNNFVNIAISVLSTLIFITIFGNTFTTAVLATLIVATFILIFGEITPKMLSAKHPDRVSVYIARPMQFVIFMLNPVVTIFTKIGNLTIRMFGLSTQKRSPLITEEEIKLMIEVGKEEGVLGDEERKLLHKIFEFGDITVSEVMNPLNQMVSIGINASAEKLLDILVEEGHSRIPVYKDSPDNIVGIIYARDLLHIWKNKELIIIPDLIHPPYFVEKAKRVNVLLREFQEKKIQIAIVQEDNKAKGLVTLEDLIEEIVGEIHPENP